MELGSYSQKSPVLLYAEDEDDTAFLFCNEFRKIAPHWEIVWTRDGLAAKGQLTDASLPEILVTDLKMPGMNGMELIQWIKDQAQLSFLPIVVRTNSGNPSDRQQCATMGTNGYLDKPASLKEIRNQIRYILKLCEEPHL